MNNMKYIPQKLVKLKNFVAIVAAILFLVLLGSVIKLFGYSTADYRTISAADYDNLKSGDLIKGIIDRNSVVLSYEEALDEKMVNCLAFLTENRKLIVITATDTNSVYGEMKALMDGRISNFSYVGQVSAMNSMTESSLQINMTLHNTYKEYGLNANNFSNLIINTGSDDSSRYTQAIIASFAGMALMLVIIFFMVRKSVNNIIYGLLVQKGVLEPELKIRKEDIVLENNGMYTGSDNDSDSFYVDTEYNVRQSGGTDGINEDYHFTKSAEQADEAFQETKVDTKPMPAYGEEFGFYHGGVNEEGNFYVQKNENDDITDTDGDYRRRY